MRRNGIGSHTSPNRGATDTWLTPPWLTKALGPFDLDPCGVSDWPTAERVIELPEDGLAAEWQGLVWMNTPYSPAEAWLRRLAGHPGGGIALIFARTETAMFQRWVWGEAEALLFLAGRIHFHHLDGARAAGNAGGPSVLVAYGRAAGERLVRASRSWRIMGALVTDWERDADWVDDGG